MAKYNKKTILPPSMEVQGHLSQSRPEVQRTETVTEYKDAIEKDHAPEVAQNRNPNVTYKGLGSKIIRLPSGKTKYIRFGEETGHLFSTSDKEIIAILDEQKYKRA